MANVTSNLNLSPIVELTPTGRYAVLAAAFLGLAFDGVELGLMPVASLSVTKSLLGEAYSDADGGVWFARFTAALMLGAAIGGSYLGAALARRAPSDVLQRAFAVLLVAVALLTAVRTLA